MLAQDLGNTCPNRLTKTKVVIPFRDANVTPIDRAHKLSNTADSFRIPTITGPITIDIEQGNVIDPQGVQHTLKVNRARIGKQGHGDYRLLRTGLHVSRSPLLKSIIDRLHISRTNSLNIKDS
jgi:hypothetical protein